MRKMIDSGVEWLGDIPETWDLVQLGSLFSEHKNKNTGMQSNNLLSLSYGNIIRKDINTSDGLLPESFEGYNVIDDGDIVLRLTDLQNDQRSLRVGLCHEKGIVTSAYVTLRKRNSAMNSQFFYYLIHSYDVRKGFYGMGAGVRQGLNYAGVRKIMLTLPPVNEQMAVADFLGEKITQVDTLIANVQAQIEKLKAYKQSVITEVVTKGLDSTVPMKDSGVENMGDIPKHWNIIRLKYLLSKIIDCPHETPLYSLDGEYYVIRTADQDVAKLRSDNDMYRLDEQEYLNRIRRQSLDKDDIVYGREGERWGLACLVPESKKYCLGQRMMQFRCRDNIVLPQFMVYALTSRYVYQQGFADTMGSTSPHVNISSIRNYFIPIPSITEQQKIADILSTKCSQIDHLITIKQTKIEKLEQYKRSLIYEYVTGKKEVTA